MKEIEQRAKKFADEFAVGDAAMIVDIIHKVAEESYIKGATEQREIDIEKSWLWMLSHIKLIGSEMELHNRIRKAMKGE